MSQLESLMEQTAFLLERQKEAKNESYKIFADLLAFIDQHLKKSVEGSEFAQSLEKIYDILAGHAQKLADEAQEDVDFLQEQLSALQELKKISDPAKAQDLLQSLIEDEEEIPETAEFKKQVSEELALSKQYLITMVDDVKAAIKEGDVAELEVLLESLDEEEESFEDEDLFEDEEEEEEEGGCGSCSSGGCGSGGCGSCPSSKGKADTDIFSFVSRYDEELKKDMTEDKKKNKGH